MDASTIMQTKQSPWDQFSGPNFTSFYYVYNPFSNVSYDPRSMPKEGSRFSPGPGASWQGIAHTRSKTCAEVLGDITQGHAVALAHDRFAFSIWQWWLDTLRRYQNSLTGVLQVQLAVASNGQNPYMKQQWKSPSFTCRLEMLSFIFTKSRSIDQQPNCSKR